MAGKQGLSKKSSMTDATANKIHKMGGQASGTSNTTSRSSSSNRGAAGRTEAAKRGGQH